jgi:hypothetical protein
MFAVLIWLYKCISRRGPYIVHMYTYNLKMLEYVLHCSKWYSLIVTNWFFGILGKQRERVKCIRFHSPFLYSVYFQWFLWNMYVYMYIDVYMYMCVCIYMCIYLCMYVCTYLCIYVCIFYVCINACIYVCMYSIYVHMFVEFRLELRYQRPFLLYCSNQTTEMTCIEEIKKQKNSFFQEKKLFVVLLL